VNPEARSRRAGVGRGFRSRGVAVQTIRRSCSGLLGLLAIAALGPRLATAQEEVPRQRATSPAASREPARTDARRAPDATGVNPVTDRYFFEDFPGAAPDPHNWELVVGVTPAGDPAAADEAAGAVRLGWDRRVAERGAELRSVPIRLAGVPAAELGYTLRQRGLESGEVLLVEYLAADGHWTGIERVVAAGRDSAGFSRRARLLPVEALHDQFRVRFRAAVDDADDAWLLGEVSVGGYDPLQTLAVRVQPAGAAQVEVFLAGRPDGLSLGAPFSRRFPVGARLFLIPPPTTDGGVFSHWAVAGTARTQRQRVLALEMTEPIEAVAYYRPTVAGRNAASVAIVSQPVPGVSIALGVEPDLLLTYLRAETEIPCLTGEWLTLLAPPRTERMVFVGWIVNGERVAGGDHLLEHCVSEDDVLIADYALLGDLNGDDVLDKYDVDLFVAALIDPLGYAEVYPELDPLERGDINGDGAFDALDVEGFVDLLLND
jgi:hypothetical protein